ncbi:tRNA threonylcarbamoyladenosine biosynthesis protein TsaB [Clostridium acetireducens DSM 10703]|jgi:tRNA threonylcarbamoyladenosine biosynthesis protein TsaB|uniref:tRNA threonylcarbamoyladenosine biosynthesis protein TsaB n=1 Tax=Clostridium acetireducens DSM 10703 TaxID=1121290 RepID=A0A1E8F1E6_9CLOT|nr:tRNA (adenosine(37)-N6)-threonylcarbamoyltransferase complex dimerization subunit type 1 TsaB [Clostridium acetireducens]OFI07430.1 tRNA threonylcarbamoyladenosine biosynthesis protein TsaB [Clostridium acetireducens DSM 10703]
MRILSLDSATESASCSIIEDNKVLGEITFNYKKQHSVILMPMVEYLLNNLKLDIESIDGFVVSKGPGSFTGLRIGAATIKGLSQGLNKPFIALSSLDALAYNLAYSNGIICPILDALRGNVYTALYIFENNNLKRISEYMIVSTEDLINILNSKEKNVHFVGDALYKFKDILQTKVKNSSFAPVHLNLVKSSSLGELGFKLLKKGIYDNIFDFKPFYIRKSQAEREYEEKNGKSYE